MKKTLLFLIPALLIVAGAVFMFAQRDKIENSGSSSVPFPNYPETNTQKALVDNTTTTTTNNTQTIITPDLSKNKISTMILDANKTYTAKMKTSVGEIDIQLNAKATPITVNNFISLAKKNFYDNTIFHRAIKDFMIQGGDPEGNGTGGPGYKFDDEPFTGEYLRGTIAMANAGPNTNGSQFFIMHADYPLPPNYVIFGKVIKGLDVVDKIAEAPVEMNASGELSKPVTPVTVLSVEITEK